MHGISVLLLQPGFAELLFFQIYYILWVFRVFFLYIFWSILGPFSKEKNIYLFWGFSGGQSEAATSAWKFETWRAKNEIISSSLWPRAWKPGVLLRFYTFFFLSRIFQGFPRGLKIFLGFFLANPRKRW